MPSLFCLGKLPYILMNARAFKNHPITPQCLHFQMSKKKLRATQAFTVAIFRFLIENYIFL